MDSLDSIAKGRIVSVKDAVDYLILAAEVARGLPVF